MNRNEQYRDYVIVECVDGTYDVLDSLHLDLEDGMIGSFEEAMQVIDDYYENYME